MASRPGTKMSGGESRNSLDVAGSQVWNSWCKLPSKDDDQMTVY
jgi:hypothetical protein